MATVELSRQQWKDYFDKVSCGLAGQRAQVEIASRQLGSQLAADWLPLFGISYDPDSDVLEVLMDGLDHRITHPRAVYVAHEGGGLDSMQVIGPDRSQQIVRFRPA